MLTIALTHVPQEGPPPPCSNTLSALEHLFVWTNVSLIGCDLTFFISRNYLRVCTLKTKSPQGAHANVDPTGPS